MWYFVMHQLDTEWTPDDFLWESFTSTVAT